MCCGYGTLVARALMVSDIIKLLSCLTPLFRHSLKPILICNNMGRLVPSQAPCGHDIAYRILCGDITWNELTPGYNPPSSMSSYAKYLDSRVAAFKILKHDVVRVQNESNRRSDGQSGACELLTLFGIYSLDRFYGLS
jgi:hypothetical protein